MFNQFFRIFNMCVGEIIGDMDLGFDLGFFEYVFKLKLIILGYEGLVGN